MIDLLISTLSGLGYPVRLQGSMLPTESYPPSFFTVWNDGTSSDGFFSNSESRIIWEYSVNFYSSDPSLVNTKIVEAKTLLRQAGFLVDGVGYDIPSDEPTHTGRSIDIIYIQEETT